MFTSKNNPSFSQEWIQQIPSSIALVDSNFKLVSASPNWLQKFQLNLKTVEGSDIFELFPAIAQELKTRLTYSLDGLKDIKIIHKTQITSNGEKDYIWHLNPWKDGYGNIIGVIVKVETISKTQELELELNKTKFLLNEKSSITKIGSWEYDIANKTVLWTPVVNSIYGVSKNFKPTLDNILELYLEGKSRETIKKVVTKAIDSGTPWNENLQLKRPDGTVIWVNSIGRPKYNDGVCTRIIGTVQNITESIEHHKNQLKIESNAYPLFDKVPFGLAIIDFNTGNFLDVNQVLLDFIKYDKEQIVDKNYREILGPNFRKKSSNLQKELTEKGIFEPLEFLFTTQNGESLNLKFSGSLVEDASGNKTILITIENITTQRHKEKDLKKTISTSHEKNEQLLNFAHMVSHNLKAHATNFSLLLNFLNAETGENERKKLMSMLFNSSDNLTDTIKGLREIVAVKTSINEEKRLLSLNDSIFLVEQNLSGLLKESHGKIINEIADSVKVKALPAYLESILTNCLTNAIKYRKPDKSPLIILNVTEDKNYTILSIEDNGLGFDMEKFGNKLFGLYNTFHTHKDARGIGLYITKNQIEAMNGKITATSIVGHGTTFKIFFNKK